jgi:hypothetical protein
MLFLRAKRRGNEFTKESFAALTKAQMARKIGERWGEQRCERGARIVLVVEEVALASPAMPARRE